MPSCIERGVAASEVQDYPWGRFVYFSDPDGNGWALQQMVPKSSTYGRPVCWPPMTIPSVVPGSASVRPAEFLAGLRAALPDMRLLIDAADTEAYRWDETEYMHPGMPLGVAFPTSTAEVSTIVRLATEHRVPRRAARRRDRPVGWRHRGRGRADRGR